jgi:nucleoid DNA-binding protein
MSKDKISSQEIIDLVSSKASVSKRAAEEFLKVLISTIEEALISGEVVKIKNFGTFKMQWNEPRKSVNVQTGEDIVLAGFHKVTFTPDNQLRDLVNEPFAHLEPVELDGSPVEKVVTPTEPQLDPLRSLNEQAFEIKNILDEIRELSSIADEKEESFGVKAVEPEHTFKLSEDVVEPIIDNEIIEYQSSESFVEEQTIVVEDAELPTMIEPEKAEKEVPHQHFEEVDIRINYNAKSESVAAEISTLVIENNHTKPAFDDSVIEENVSIQDAKTRKSKHKKTWVIILLSLTLLIVVGVGAYSFYPPARDLTDRIKFTVLKKSESVSMTDMFNTVTGWFTSKKEKEIVPQSIVIPKDTTQLESIEAKPDVDSLQTLFDNPRIYNEFLGTERIRIGSRLTYIAKRYYGNKVFWVYIYEANRNHIVNPDRVPVGTLIKVPKVDKRLIDSSNERCIQTAKELHDIYVK